MFDVNILTQSIPRYLPLLLSLGEGWDEGYVVFIRAPHSSAQAGRGKSDLFAQVHQHAAANASFENFVDLGIQLFQ